MVSHKQKLEELEEYLIERKRNLTEDLRFFIQLEESGKLDEEGKIHQIATESNVLLIEELGSGFFNWE
jgi:uncharacterized protein YjgD (DUF1641 family)